MVDAKGKPSYVEGVGVLATQETLGGTRGLEALRVRV